MYGISGLCSYIYILLRIYCNVSALGSRIERIKMVIAIQMRDVLFSLFFSPLSSLSLYLFSSLYPGSGMRLLCPRFLSFILDSR